MKLQDVTANKSTRIVTISEFAGKPIICLPVKDKKDEAFQHTYGQTRLWSILQHLPEVIAFVKSGGTSIDPSTVTEDDVRQLFASCPQVTIGTTAE